MRCLLVTALALAAGCKPPSHDDAGASDAGVDSTWHVVLEGLPAPLLSAWEAPDGTLYAVGGTASRALILRHDSSGWWEMNAGTTQGLWWVFGFSASDVYAVGNHGVITHFDGTRWTVEREGGDDTLYGVWGPGPGELLAVGGNVASSRASSVVLSQRSGWSRVTTGLPPTQPLFKLWGRSAADEVLVGERGLLASGSATTFTSSLSPTSQRLTTVAGNASEVYVVGGLTEPVAFRRVGAEWKSIVIPGTPAALFGVAVAADDETLLCGTDGYLATGRGETFAEENSPTRRSLHAALSTRDGFVAVGGDLLGTLGQGVLISSGSLSSGALRAWPHDGVPFDAGIDAGLDGGSDAGLDAGAPDGGDDAGVSDASVDAGDVDAGETDAGEVDAGADGGGVDAGPFGPGESCDTNFMGCAPGLDCWFVFGPFKSYCASQCTDVSQCGAAYGANPWCRVPGPQAMNSICLADAVCTDAGM